MSQDLHLYTLVACVNGALAAVILEIWKGSGPHAIKYATLSSKKNLCFDNVAKEIVFLCFTYFLQVIF